MKPPTKTKDTPSCADATHRCPARLRPKAGQPETRRATRDSDIRLSDPLSASTARRCAKGPQYSQARCRSLKVELSRVESADGLIRQEPGRSPRLQLGVRYGSRFGRTAYGDGDAQWRRVSGALRRCGQLSEGRQSDPSSVRIPSPLRVGVHRRSRRCARVSFCLLTFFWTSKRSESHSSAKQEVRLTRECRKTRG